MKLSWYYVMPSGAEIFCEDERSAVKLLADRGEGEVFLRCGVNQVSVWGVTSDAVFYGSPYGSEEVVEEVVDRYPHHESTASILASRGNLRKKIARLIGGVVEEDPWEGWE